MLAGARRIIGGVPALNLDPFLLAESQQPGPHGYILIAHREPRPLWDLLILEGPRIMECARMTSDARSSVSPQRIGSRLQDHRRSASVFLFEASFELLERFMTTLHTEPCLKVHTASLTPRQIREMVRATGCRRGILEHNSFGEDPPLIELHPLAPGDPLPRPSNGPGGGRLLLYDLEAASEGGIAETPRGASHAPVALESPADPPVRTTPEDTRHDSSEGCGNQMEIFDGGIRRSSPPPPAPPPGSPGAGPTESPTQREDPADPYLFAFRRLFRSFRREAFECLGGRCEEVMARAEQEVRLLEPGFNLLEPPPEAAPLLLSVMEGMVERAPLLKRGRLRQTARTLVADLYNKHYDLLERHNAVDRVEQSYVRLGK
ncbi:MAG: hypothetical protein WB626_08495 [Bacteroidota bacterium]